MGTLAAFVVFIAFFIATMESFQRNGGKSVIVSSPGSSVNKTHLNMVTAHGGFRPKFKVYKENKRLFSRQAASLKKPSKLFMNSNAELFGSKVSVPKPAIKKPLGIIIAGAPASGKGTQCEIIKEKYGVVHLSTGDILRAAVKEGTELGLKAKAFMDAGKLVPDELIIGVVSERLNQEDCQCRGWLLDGFPRTKSQADALIAAGKNPDCFILLDVPEEVLVERVTGRRTDPVTGKIYHMKFSPPENEEIAKRLVQRSDDTEEKIKIRYREFQSHINAIRSSYEDKMICVDGACAPKHVTESIVKGVSHILEKAENQYKDPLRIIIAGAPASGKGTQCEIIKEKYGVVHLSTGDILRAAVKEGTELGLKAKAFMDAGKLVPDELIIGVVSERLNQEDCQCRGWLLDGFPRTKSQADALIAAGKNPDCFILLDVPEEVLVERVTGRRTDPVTGKIYHMKFSPPENEEIAKRLVQRSDDTEEKIKIRYREFQSHINAIRSSYEDKLVVVNGAQSTKSVSDGVTSNLDKILDKKQSKKNQDKEGEDDDNNDQSTTGGASKNAVTTSTNKQVQTKDIINKTALGMVSLITFDRLLNKLFLHYKIAFPSSLSGMISVFLFLSIAVKVLPKQLFEKFFYNLSYSIGFIKAWLVLFFLPPLTILPLKLSSLRGNEIIMFVVMIVFGTINSLISTGWISQGMTMIRQERIIQKKEQSQQGKEGQKEGIVTSLSSSASTTSSSSPVLLPVAPMPNLPNHRIFLLSSLFSLISIKLSLVASRHFSSSSSLHPRLLSALIYIYSLSSTVAGFLLTIRLPAKLKNFLPPILTASTYTVASLWLLSNVLGKESYPLMNLIQGYYGQGSGPGDHISSLLGASVISFGIQLFQYQEMLWKNKIIILTTTILASLFGILSSAFIARFFKFQSDSVVLAALTRCITTPLAIAGSKFTGADLAMTVLAVVIAGIVGSCFGENILSLAGIKDPFSVGLALGNAAHGLGSAAVAKSPEKFSAAVVSMTLTGVWTVILLFIPNLRNFAIKTALRQ